MRTPGPDVSELASVLVATLTDGQLETAISEGEARWKAGRWAIGDSIVMDALTGDEVVMAGIEDAREALNRLSNMIRCNDPDPVARP